MLLLVSHCDANQGADDFYEDHGHHARLHQRDHHADQLQPDLIPDVQIGD